MEIENITNKIKDQFIQEYSAGRKPTVRQYVEQYPHIDIDEFIAFGMAFAMIQTQLAYNKKENNNATR
jgi:hypothetical protein